MATGPADAVLDIGKSVLWDLLLKKAVTDFLTNKLFLLLIKVFGDKWAGILLGPMGWVATLVFQYVGGIIYKHGKDFINITTVGLLNEKEQAEYDRASATLAAIARDQGIDSEKFKEASIVAHKEFSDFIKFGVARS
jgi:hypothetical protein